MLKIKKIVSLNLFLALLVLTVSGCKTGKRMVYANYIMPPKVISDVTKVQKLVIANPDIDLNISGVDRHSAQKIASVFSNTIVNDFSSKLYYNGYIKTADHIYGDPTGLKQVGRILASSRHGYDIKIIPAYKTAKLKIEAKIKYTRSTGKDRIKTTLTTTNYQIKTNKNGVPFSVPTSSSSRIVTSNVPYINVEATGSLICTVYDYRGKKLYSRTFNDLKFENKSGGDSGCKAEAPYLEVAQSLFIDSVNKVISDISPHKETRALVVNEKGNASVVALIKGTAFFDAKEKLGKILDKEEAEIEKASTETNAKYAQLIAEAEDAEKKAALEQERKEELIAISKDYSPDFENMAIILEIIGDRNEALEYYSIAADYDPENKSAKESFERVDKMLESARRVSGHSDKDYESQMGYK